MKKQYISPVCEVVKIEMSTLLAGTMEIQPGEGTPGDMDDIGDGGIGGGSHSDFWGE